MTDSSPLKAFSAEQFQRAKLHLATQVAHMMGRKMEEGDWTHVYCLSKGIPPTGWSNLNIDVKLSRTISDEPGAAWCENAAVINALYIVGQENQREGFEPPTFGL
jgi:hypothetical protein